MDKEGYNYSFGINRIEIELYRNFVKRSKSLKKGTIGRGGSGARTTHAMQKRVKGSRDLIRF